MALDSVGKALADHVGKVTYITDSQFDDEAVWGAIWEQGNHLVCRLKHQERLVEQQADDAEKKATDGVWRTVSIGEVKGQAREIARYGQLPPRIASLLARDR